MAVLPPLPKKLLLFLTQLVEAREVVWVPGEVIPPKRLGRILLRDLHKTLEAPEEGEEMEEEKEMEKDVEDEDYKIILIYLLLFYCNHLFFLST